MDKIEIPLNLKCISNGEFSIIYEHIKKVDTDKDNNFICVWFSDNVEPDVMIYAGEGQAKEELDEMFKCIRKASMKVVQPTLKLVK